ncbi:MAG: LicD family protein, partial [Clostridiales bacterium]|nr:LicD family protein [Clostridiales bacterium]
RFIGDIMQEMTLEERKAVSLEILLQIDSLCKQHSIRYYLAYGGLIGAVRHGGFIPWDDDLDIWMEYEDYKKFEAVAGELDGYYLLKAFDSKGWGRTFGKLCKAGTLIVDDLGSKSVKRGVSVDVFPLFKCSKADADKLVDLTKMIDRSFRYQNGYIKSTLKKLVLGLYAFVGKSNKYYCKKFVKFASGLNGDMYYAPSPYLGKDVHESALFDSAQISFEGHELCAPKGLDRILTAIYGDYMTPPPEAERISNHKVKAYWVDGNNGEA